MKLWQFILVLAAVMVAGAAALVGFNYVVMPRLIHRHTVVLMPDIRGMSIDGATTEVSQLQLQIVETRSRAHPTIPQGMILDQNPGPEDPIRTGRVVRVVTSSGPPAGAVPDLLGLTGRQAEITLQRESYRQGRLLRIRRPGVTVPTVVYQNPAAGEAMRKGRAVDIVLAEPAPPALYRMPDLRGAPLFQARQRIAGAGFVLAPVSFERTRDLPPNTILAQIPSAGTRIEKGARIELVATSR